jgi:hypothetical protein
MADTGRIPEWLRHSLEQTPTRPFPFPEEEEWPLEVVPGDIRAARDMDGAGPARLVLVIERFADPHAWVNALLISPAVEIATDHDVRLDPSETGLSFPILVETDTGGPLFEVQFGKRIGNVSEQTLQRLLKAADGHETVLTIERTGLPVLQPSDGRWTWKESEIDAMQGLGASVLFQQLLQEEDPSLDAPIVDPQVLEVEAPAAEEGIRGLLALAELAATSGLEVPQEGLMEAGRLREWVEALPPDLARALGPLWEQALSSSVVVDPPPAVRWHPRPDEPWSGSIDARIAARAVRGARALRLITRREHAHEDDLGDIVAAEVVGVGRVQITRMDVMEREAA